MMCGLVTDLVLFRSGILTKEVEVAGHHFCQLLSRHLPITMLMPFIK